MCVCFYKEPPPTSTGDRSRFACVMNSHGNCLKRRHQLSGEEPPGIIWFWVWDADGIPQSATSIGIRTFRHGWRLEREPERRRRHCGWFSSNRTARPVARAGQWWCALRELRRPRCRWWPSRSAPGSWEWEPIRHACRPPARCDIDLM